MTPSPEHLQRLLAEEPFVRALARALVAHDADDVVQQTWVRALQHDPEPLQRPRSWLATIVRNLVADRRRRETRRAARERAAAANEQVPSSLELLEAEEHRREMVRAVDALPEHLRTVVLLRYYEGLPPRRIAAEQRVPVSTVYNRLHEAIVELRRRLDAKHGGDRRAWLLALAPFAASPRQLPWREVALGKAVEAGIPVIAMTMNYKLLAAAAVLLAGAIWLAWPQGEVPGDNAPAPGPGAPVVAAQADVERRETPTATPGAVRSDASVPIEATATTGTLSVDVRYEDEPTLGAGVWLILLPNRGDLRVDKQIAVTDASGRARFDGLLPGNYRLYCSLLSKVRLIVRGDDDTTDADLRGSVRVDAGKTTEAELRVSGGMTLHGVVVDGSGTPVAGALIETAHPIGGAEAEVGGVSAADGTFTLRHVFEICWVGARAPQHASSGLAFVMAKPGETRSVRIELLQPGGSLRGTVRDAEGRPVARAVVRVGDGVREGNRSATNGEPPLPAQTHSGDDGTFLAVGVPAGNQPVQVRANGFAPWRSNCDVLPGGTAQLEIRLGPGLHVRGVVQDGNGKVVPAVEVIAQGAGDFVTLSAVSAGDGTFELHDLPPEGIELKASHVDAGKARAEVGGSPGQTVELTLTLSRGPMLRGRVVDDDGAPVQIAHIRARAVVGGKVWLGHGMTDGDGVFRVNECPAGAVLDVHVESANHLSLDRRGLTVGSEAIELRLQRDRRPRARILGRLLRSDGSPAVGVDIDGSAVAPQRYRRVKTAADGSFVMEVAPAGWWLSIAVDGHPLIEVPTRQLEPGEVWDVGSLQLTVGGHAVVRDPGGGQVRLTVCDLRERHVSLLSSSQPGSPIRSALIAPGEYVLLVSGPGVTAQRVPLTIQSGRDTEVTFTRVPGVVQQVEIVLPADADPQYSVSWIVRQGTTMIATGSCRRGEDGRYRGELQLRPGDYTIECRDPRFAGSAPLRVGETAGAPVQVTVQAR